MPRGAYTAKQDRKANHIEKSYEKRGVSKKEAESRAWATVNKQDGGGKRSGSGTPKGHSTRSGGKSSSSSRKSTSSRSRSKSRS